MPDTNPYLLISQTIQDATLTIYLNVTIQKWCSTCHSIFTALSSTARSLTTLLQVSQYVTLYHYLLRSSKKRPNTYEEVNQYPEKIARSKNKSKSNKGTAVLQPTGNPPPPKDTLRIKDRDKTTKNCPPVMKGICNAKGAALCLPFLLGSHCECTDPYGYHLQVNDPDRPPGTSNTDYAPFTD